MLGKGIVFVDKPIRVVEFHASTSAWNILISIVMAMLGLM